MWRLRQWLGRLTEGRRTRKQTARLRRRKQEWQRNLGRFPIGPNGKVLLHVGCGDVDAPGFINVDARPGPHVHIATKDLDRLEMIPDGVADLVYMCHVLEHVSYRSVKATLKEMLRVLRSGGVLRISVPDFDRIVEIYEASDRTISAIQGPLMGGQEYVYNYHYSVFNLEHLSKLMLSSGFVEVRQWDPYSCTYHDFSDWANGIISAAGREFPISLNIEAVKA